ncbi:hypothetical protein N9848_05910 [Flavobacteriaceae bacterium]|jgi:hypothetical protein|nr:hypothetical protein [Flavobacteriaceae bacterium]MDB4256154.1 hypothetical protein [Flavobacteriaceae bacterium]|tara:strand:- start:265 stop:678 length:414 start_codon:yes stop_codon:yes gene_type:complete
MKISKGVITKGFVLSGIMNIGGVLIFSRFFTNDAITAADPVVISNFGLLMIVVWGLVFLSVSQKYEELNWLVGVFAIEKFLYGLNWINWISNNDLFALFNKDQMAGIFYALYGINDWLFFLFFLYVFIKSFKFEKAK